MAGTLAHPRADVRPLLRDFYDRNAAQVAKELLGCVLVRRFQDGRVVAVRLVETEAYVGAHDRACHSSIGRTARNQAMFGPPGRLYVYLVYGLHHCCNVVCGPGLDPNAVLLRAAAPLSADELCLLGLSRERMRSPLHSTSGPGNLARALDVSLAHDALDLCAARSALWVLPRLFIPRIVTGPRIGVQYAGAWSRRHLRFCERNSPFVSRPRL